MSCIEDIFFPNKYWVFTNYYTEYIDILITNCFDKTVSFYALLAIGHDLL